VRHSRAAAAARRLDERLRGPRWLPRETRALFRALGPGSLAVDCGANVGRVTAALAARGADVYAFEPNPHAYAVLHERFAADPRVRCLPQAVATEAGRALLYLHVHARDDPLAWSTASSLLAEKGNVDPASAVEVETVDLDAYLAGLGRRVQLLKLDVEGTEVDLLERLLETGRLGAIDHVLVEMHDRRIPALAERGAALRAALAAPAYAHVRLDWI
jgi:FkbM family methyltransferase